VDASRRSFWAAFVAAISFFAAFYSLIVPLPLYMTDMGIPDWQIGVIMGAFGVASLIGRPFAGYISDRYGFKPVILFGSIALAIGGFGVPLTADPALLFGLRMLQAAGYVAFTTASTALVSSLIESHERGRFLALFGAAANVAITIVPAVVTTVLPSIGLSGAFVASGVMALGAGLLIWWVIPQQELANTPFVWREVFSYPRQLWPAMATTALFGVGFGAYFQYLPLLAEKRGIEQLGWAYTVYGVSIIATRLLSGRLLDLPDRRRVLLPAAMVMASGLLGFALADSIWMLLVAAALTASGGGVFHPALIAIHVDSIEARGKATAAFYLAFDLGIGVGAWLLAPILEYAGIGAMYAVAAAITLAAGFAKRFINLTR
jgi:MFS family permease